MEPPTRYARVFEDYKSTVLLIKLWWHSARLNPRLQGVHPGVPRLLPRFGIGWWEIFSQLLIYTGIGRGTQGNLILVHALYGVHLWLLRLGLNQRPFGS